MIAWLIREAHDVGRAEIASFFTSQEIMNNESWKKCNDFVEANEEVKALRLEMKALIEEARKSRRSCNREVRKVALLLHGFDAAIKYFCQFEDMDEGDSEILEKYTTDCGDCWASTWDQVTDLLMETGINQCEVVVKVKQQLAQHEQAITEQQNKVDILTRNLRESYMKNHKEEQS